MEVFGEEGALRAWLSSRFDILQTHLANSALLQRKVSSAMEERRNVDHEAAQTSLLVDKLKEEVSSLQSNLEDHKRNYNALVHDQRKLELENEDLRRKLVAALLLGKLEETSVIHFLEKNPRAPELTEGIIATQSKLCELSKQDGPISRNISTPLVLHKKVRLLEEYIGSLKAQQTLQVLHLKERERKAMEERKSLRAHYTKRLAALVGKLDETERLLEKTVEQNVELQGAMVDGERKWAEEEERLICLLHDHHPVQWEDALPQISGGAKGSKKASIVSERRLKEQLARTEGDLLTATNTLKEYELKFMRMEEKVERLRSQLASTQSHYTGEVEKLRRNNEMLESRSERLDTHRRLEAQGFRADLKDLKEKLNALRVNFERFEMGLVKCGDLLEDGDKSAVFDFFVGASVEAARRVQSLESQVNKKGGSVGSSSQ